ncbi:MAG TPA: transglutaminase family protein [Ottowia sp.]|uniref:transglutaminase-like domain-containing protein n=1 Tax=Ottowia sp. TaxID=1898956 RepID=UPI002BD7AB19|nr:transglutaminase family protein [Ottowia sp.]HRQ03221.1 transglutaminase family protein [Ottowia sp.]
MLIRIGYDIELALTSPTTLLGALHVHPSRAPDLQAPEAFSVEPALPVRHYQDVFDNTITRINVPAGVASLRLRNRAVVADSGRPDPMHADARQHALHELPNEVFRFLLPSRYCEVDSALLQFAWDRFGQSPQGWPRVQAICDYVHRHIRFDYQQARANRSALEAWREGVGVCRDYAHLALTLCRCMNIPARYTTGYLGDIGVASTSAPMDFTGWFQAWLGGRWHDFDARNNTPRIGRIVMAHGHDAADVPITMVFGDSRLKRFEVVTDELPAAA